MQIKIRVKNKMISGSSQIPLSKVPTLIPQEMLQNLLGEEKDPTFIIVEISYPSSGDH